MLVNEIRTAWTNALSSIFAFFLTYEAPWRSGLRFFAAIPESLSRFFESVSFVSLAISDLRSTERASAGSSVQIKQQS
jgi:hypothetical protein